jgi:hypothetical protein
LRGEENYVESWKSGRAGEGRGSLPDFPAFHIHKKSLTEVRP